MKNKLIYDLSWYRLTVKFLNSRSSKMKKASFIEVFQAITKGITTSIDGENDPKIFFDVVGRSYKKKFPSEGDILTLNFYFCNHSVDYVTRWIEALHEYMADPVSGRNYALAFVGEIEERDYTKLSAEKYPVNLPKEISLNFLTPLSFTITKGKGRTFIYKRRFVHLYALRLKSLFGININEKGLDVGWDIFPYYWNYTEIKHPSLSQRGSKGLPNEQWIKGCVGRVYLKGDFKDVFPLFLLGSEVHTGSKITNSQGYYTIDEKYVPYFDSYFPNKGNLISVIDDVAERYDNALQSIAIRDGFSVLKKGTLAEELAEQIKDDSFIPTPHTAFKIKKKSGKERLVEQVDFKDLILHLYLYKTLQNEFERMFEEGSIGFRKGISRETGEKMIREAIKGGYTYVIESDIEDFFPSIDLLHLEKVIDFYLPAGDILIRKLLKKIIYTGYIMNGVLHERVEGLAQGSPLSPLLANLYLDSFDEEILKNNVKIIRYADDFIILTKTIEKAEEMMEEAEESLSSLGLSLSKDKTSIGKVEDGFDFLGIHFDGVAEINDDELYRRRLKKPLYLTEPYLFMALNGESIDIKRHGKVIESIPIRRISEIMVMEKALFSTSLLTQCTNRHIPFTIILNSGYYITTIKPDSKKYYDISAEQYAKYNLLSDTEQLSIAKGFAAGKLNNYISLFRQRYAKGVGRFVDNLNREIEAINMASDINQVRGVEGQAAKGVFKGLNVFINNPAFQIKKRDRKNPDAINSLLNFSYYLLFSRINATIRSVGINPYLGFLHSPQNDYESLVCDVEELFRSRIDRFVLRLLNLEIITEADFRKRGKKVYLKSEAIKKYLDHFEHEMEKKGGGNTLSLKESIYVQAMVLKRFFTEEESLSFYRWTL